MFMRVLHIVGGRLKYGAGRGALYLHNALLSLDVNSRLVCPDPNAEGDGIISLSGSPYGWLTSRLRSTCESLPSLLYPTRLNGLFSPGLCGRRWQSRGEYKTADIIHLHWVNKGMVSISGLTKIDKPCVWTLRDMWPFTGGCHYALDCQRYSAACGACPALGSRHPHDLSQRVFQRKAKYYPHQMTIVGISSWISECARSSPLLRGNDVRTIMNCVDIGRFAPLDKTAARKRLGLPRDRLILLHGAMNLSDDYKGGAVLERAKSHLSEKIYICDFGNKTSDNALRSDRSFGYIGDDEVLRTLYCAADVLVFPSIQEAFGKVAAEALSCGTPAVVFDGTGPAEIVQHKLTGYVAASFDPVDLANGVHWLLADGHRLVEISRNASADARRRFNPVTAARQYLELYREKVGVLSTEVNESTWSKDWPSKRGAVPENEQHEFNG
jgi:glycosyltransferase involved in cell wall biosynthesis